MTPCRVAVYAIAKDEAKHAARWAASCADADYRVVLDTGSTDDTVELLAAAGVVVTKDSPDRPFRFDVARNLALSLVPADTDICVSLDLDEVLDPGFIDDVRAQWEIAHFDLGRPWFNTGGWWRNERVHARHGYEWRMPCHEVTVWTRADRAPVAVDLPCSMQHWPDDHDRNPLYLELLNLAVTENPNDARMWWYLCRQHYYAQQWAECIHAATKVLDLGSYPPEIAAACRLAAEAAATLGALPHPHEWLYQGVEAAPNQTEAWAAVARFHRDRDEWQLSLDAALYGLQCPTDTHYMADQQLRSWGMLDFAALAHYNLGNFDDAVSYGYQAFIANPEDGRLLENLRWYVKAVDRPVAAVIATAPGGGRQGELSRLTDQLVGAGVVVHVDGGDRPLHEKWNAMLDDVARSHHANEWDVFVINDDVVIDADFVTIMRAALRANSLTQIAHPAQDDGSFTGWALAMRGETELHYDPGFEWWYGDTDLVERVKHNGGLVTACPAKAQHLYPNESTFSNPEHLAAARRDEAYYAAKWKVDPQTLFFGRNSGTFNVPDEPLSMSEILDAAGINEDNLEEALLGVARDTTLTRRPARRWSVTALRVADVIAVSTGGSPGRIAATLNTRLVPEASKIAESIAELLNDADVMP